METSGSLIPKKDIIRSESVGYKEKASPGVFLAGSVILLVLSLLFLAGTFIYKKALEKRIGELSNSFRRAQAAFDPSLISEIENVSKKIESAKMILGNHIALSPIFHFLEENTLENVRFSSFSFKPVISVGKISIERPTISMRGFAENYSTLALQVKTFQASEDVKSVAVSGVSLSDDGSIRFDVDIAFSKNFIKYANALSSSAGEEEAASPENEEGQ